MVCEAMEEGLVVYHDGTDAEAAALILTTLIRFCSQLSGQVALESVLTDRRQQLEEILKGLQILQESPMFGTLRVRATPDKIATINQILKEERKWGYAEEVVRELSAQERWNLLTPEEQKARIDAVLSADPF
jgi:hypothetical protein